MKKIKILSIIMVVLLGLSGCTKKDDKSLGKYDTTSNNSQYIHLSMVTPKTINPINNTEQSVGYVMNLVYDSLFTIDSNYNTVPQLVENYSIESNGKSIAIKLKDAKWHDGKQVTSSDVEFTINLIKGSQNSPYKPLVENISSVSINDSKNFTINFKDSYAFSVDTLVFPIVSKSELSGLSSNELNNYRKNMIGTGPYKISKFEQRSNMILTLNEDYYDKEKIKNAKKEINVIIVPDEEAQVAMTLALSSDITKVGLSDLSQFQEEQFKITNFEGRGYEYIIFNYDTPIMKDLNFRKAIASAINRNNILQEAYMGKATAVNFPLHSKSKYYDESIKAFEYNKEKAKEYLEKINIENVKSNKPQEESNKTKNKDNEEDKIKDKKINNKEDERKNSIKEEIKSLDLRIVVNKENRERVKSAYIIKENLSEIGIKSTVYELEGQALDSALDKKEYDLALVGWELSIVPDATNIINYSGYSDEKLTSYLNSLKISSNVNDTKDIYKSIQKYTRDKVSFISLGITDDYLVNNKRVEGNLKPNDFDIYEGIYYLKLDE